MGALFMTIAAVRYFRKIWSLPFKLSMVTFFNLILLTGPASVEAQEEIVCITCHARLKGRLSDPVQLWRGSIHAANGITCDKCHGGDPKDSANAMSPERSFIGAPKEHDVPSFCGRCHRGIRDDYARSAHGSSLGHGGPTCVTCHSNHAVVKASIELINEKLCGRCHSFDRARVIREALQQTEYRIHTLENDILHYKTRGVDTDSLDKSLFAMRNRYHSLAHVVDVNRIKGESGRINDELNRLEKALKKIDEEFARRRILGVFIVGIALLSALLFYLLRKSYDNRA
jgi:hypothetical protein